jgi:hypothetical protein
MVAGNAGQSSRGILPPRSQTGANATARRGARSTARTAPTSCAARPKDMPADCSTGEQKALLVGIVLSHARLTARCRA